MATLHFTQSPSFTITNQKQHPTTTTSTSTSTNTNTKLPAPFHLKPSLSRYRSLTTIVKSYKVVIEHEGQATELDVGPDETILAKALDSGLSVPHDCKLGVCMTCPAKLVSGTVDQSEGMLSDDVVERGYALLCASYPRSDCHFRTIPEEDLLALQLATAND